MQTWYYSSNGERQGPVSYEELKTLARSGRLNPTADLAWTEGMADWKPSGQISGLFHDAAPGPSGNYNPYAAPSTASDDLLAPAVGGEIVPGSFALDAPAVIGRSIDLTKRHFGLLLGVGAVYCLTVWAMAGLLEGVNYMISPPAPVSVMFGPTTPESIWETQLAAFGQHSFSWQYLLINLVSWGFNTFMALGLAKVALNVVSGKEVSVGMLFSQGDKFWRGIGASFLYYLMVGLGLILLIVPGIYLGLRFMMIHQVIVDRNLGVMDSLRYSSELTRNNRFNLFVLCLLSFLITIAGALVCLVGLIFAIPVVTLAFAVAYRVLQYGQRAMLDQPGTTTPQLLALTGPF